MSSDRTPNRLASEPSLYLRQHSTNPVDWHPWGDDALALARELDRPILLSVGYSACHWCHVMERECFEDEEIAALMNRLFVCIKVDREERPDLDHLYMKALQGMTGRGGWPMTVFLTPDRRPYYAGTYFPPEDRGGMPGFPRVLLGVAKAWAEQRDEVLASAGKVADFLSADGGPAGSGAVLDAASFLEAAAKLVESMDGEHGGFGKAPKFPGAMALTLLLDAEDVAADPGRRRLTRLTLDRMAAGGIRDHLGGGFHRYSVDREWLVPHFEKMLYDQALLARLYLEGARFFRDRDLAEVTGEILEYVLREMTSEDGAFHATQDADSEGEEGRFFLWTRDEVLAVLGPERGERFCRAYDVGPEGNFEGRTILRRRITHRDLEDAAGSGEADALERELAASRAELFRRRALRVPPGRDDKIVADWNGLMISAFAAAGRVLERSEWVDAAQRAVDFVRRSMTGADGLLHLHAEGEARVPAFLDDYAFFGRACLDLFEARPSAENLEAAGFCARRLLDEFLHESGEGFCFTSSRAEPLVARTRDLFDGAVPSGNSVAAELLLRLWALTGDDDYRRGGEGVLTRFLPEALANPYGGAHLLAVAERNRRGWATVVVSGEPSSRKELVRAALETRDPARAVIELDDPSAPWIPAAIAGKSHDGDGARAWVCRGATCSMPVAGGDELRTVLDGGATTRSEG